MEGDRGAGGVRETGEERAGSGISTRTGSGGEIKKGKRSLFIPVKNTNPATFYDLHLTFSEASNKILYVRKRKFLLGLKKTKKQDMFW